MNKQSKKVERGVIEHAALENNRVYLLRTEIAKSHFNSRICQHFGVKTSTVTPSFNYVFNISLSCIINIPSFIGNLWWDLLLGNHLNISYFDFSHRSLVSYSNGCGGQNKNQTIISLYVELQRTGVYEILNHKFLVRGHTFLENDRDFAQIEKTKNSAKVVLPDDCIKVVRDTNLRKPFQVNNIQYSF